MKNPIFLICAVSFFSQFALAQQSFKEAKVGVNVSYYGESAYHPGFLVGAEYAFFHKTKSKEKVRGSKSKTKIRTHKFILSGGLGLYNHPQNRKMLFIEPAMTYRYITPRRFKLEMEIGLGYMRSFYNAETIKLTDDLGFETVRAAGRSKLKPSAALFIGNDFSNREKFPFSWQLGFPIYLEVPYNHTSIITTALEVGMTFFIVNKNQK